MSDPCVAEAAMTPEPTDERIERLDSAEAATPAASGESSRARSADAALEVPEDALILIPTRNLVLFPGIVIPLTVGRGASVAAAQEAARRERPLGVLLQRDPQTEAPGPDDLHTVGKIGRAHV